MCCKLLRTENDFVLTVLRVVLGVVFFAHGAQKVLGWWGGPGFEQTVTMFTEQMSLPAQVAYLVMACEFLGGAALVVGFLGRVAALGIIVIMVGAIAMVHGQHGLFLAQKGFEYNLVLIAVALAVMVKGSGALSVDHVLAGPPDRN